MLQLDAPQFPFGQQPEYVSIHLRDLLQIQDEALAIRFEIKDVFGFDHIFQLHSTTWGNNQAALVLRSLNLQRH